MHKEIQGNKVTEKTVKCLCIYTGHGKEKCHMYKTKQNG